MVDADAADGGVDHGRRIVARREVQLLTVPQVGLAVDGRRIPPCIDDGALL